ncbi:hypothetical protein [Kamptonema formosum]|uniref:hypothetical protein n=1 Tax=Kamptonema formosum TaxID=331992 RepID=UPI000348AC29|nr:hypothetical protein [Oscillatoria sp. PCC 10802]
MIALQVLAGEMRLCAGTRARPGEPVLCRWCRLLGRGESGASAEGGPVAAAAPKMGGEELDLSE